MVRVIYYDCTILWGFIPHLFLAASCPGMHYLLISQLPRRRNLPPRGLQSFKPRPSEKFTSLSVPRQFVIYGLMCLGYYGTIESYYMPWVGDIRRNVCCIYVDWSWEITRINRASS